MGLVIGPEDIQPCSRSAGPPGSSGASGMLGMSGSSPGTRIPCQPRCSWPGPDCRQHLLSVLESTLFLQVMWEEQLDCNHGSRALVSSLCGGSRHWLLRESPELKQHRCPTPTSIKSESLGAGLYQSLPREFSWAARVGNPWVGLHSLNECKKTG